MTVADAPSRPPVPPRFLAAVADLHAARPRAEVSVTRIGTPQRLAPWAYALGVEVRTAAGTPATGRLVLLHDPAGQQGWDGEFRFVAFASADIDPEIGWDPMLSGVTWSWLVDALALRGAAATAMGGTVTQTASTRFGALATAGSAAAEPAEPEIDLDEPTVALEVELRGSWTPVGDDFGAHLLGFADLLCTAAGLPPEGVADLSGR
jgi:hypothetical protein